MKPQSLVVHAIACHVWESQKGSIMCQQAAARTARILIVEDERQTARLMEYILKKEGYETEKAADGLQALALISEFQPDVILLDLQLPEVSGLEVLRRVRANPSWAHTTVIVLTASSFDQISPAEILSAGADSHCTKPIAPSTLIGKLNELGITARLEPAP